MVMLARIFGAATRNSLNRIADVALCCRAVLHHNQCTSSQGIQGVTVLVTLTIASYACLSVLCTRLLA